MTSKENDSSKDVKISATPSSKLKLTPNEDTQTKINNEKTSENLSDYENLSEFDSETDDEANQNGIGSSSSSNHSGSSNINSNQSNPVGENLLALAASNPLAFGTTVRNGVVVKKMFTNTRERFRQQNVSSAFAELRKIVPVHPIDKKLSKNEILRAAIKYIRLLTNVLEWQKQQEENSENIITNGLARSESHFSCVNYIISKKYNITNPIEKLNHNKNLLMIAPTPFSISTSGFPKITIPTPKLSSSPFFQNCKTSFIKSENMNHKSLNSTTSIFNQLLRTPCGKNFTNDGYHNTTSFTMKFKTEIKVENEGSKSDEDNNASRVGVGRKRKSSSKNSHDASSKMRKKN